MKVAYGWEENFWHRVILSLSWQQPLLFPYWVSSQFSWDVWLKVLVRDGLCWGSLRCPVKDLGIWKITISIPLILESVNVQMLFCSTDWYYCYPLVKCHTHPFIIFQTLICWAKPEKWSHGWRNLNEVISEILKLYVFQMCFISLECWELPSEVYPCFTANNVIS